MGRLASLAFVGLLALGGCESAVQKAEREAAMVERTGDQAALCEARKKLADAYLGAHDEPGYRRAKLAADTICTLNDLRRANGGGAA